MMIYVYICIRRVCAVNRIAETAQTLYFGTGSCYVPRAFFEFLAILLPKARIAYMSTIPGTPLLKAEETAEDHEGDVRGSKRPLLYNKGLPLRVGQ